MGAQTDGRTAVVLELHRLLVEDTPLEVVRQLAVARIAALTRGAAALWLDDGGDVSLAAFSHPDAGVQAEMLQLTGGLAHGEHSFVRTVITGGQPLSLTGAQVAASLPLMEPAYATFFADHPVAGMLLHPLRCAGASIGLLGVARDGEPFDDEDLSLLADIGYVTSVVLHSLQVQERQQQALQDARRQEAAQEQLAHTDELTHLLNRRGFRRALPPTTPASVTALGVLLLDLDDFKAVNDGFGHATGDALLVSCASHLRAALPAGAQAARLGGDEFAVLLRGADGQDVRRLARELRDSFPTAMELLGVEVALGVSGGLVVAPPGTAFDPERAVQLADVAMYRAKRNRTGLAEYDAVTDAAALRRLHDVARLRRGIAGGELVLHYQRLSPVGTSEHLEALVRWQRDGELVAPGGFLPLAQEIGAMPELTAVVLDLAVEQLAVWSAEGREVTVAVNIPAPVLAGAGLVEDVLSRLSAAGLGPASLALEVTEGELVDEAARTAVRHCREHGLRVAIDDFGTGYSALAYLLDVPATWLKIDRALVGRLHEEPARQTLVRHCTQLAHELGMQVVAEGVELEVEADVLLGLGVDLLQGFHVHRPCPASQVWASRPGISLRPGEGRDPRP